MFHGTPYASKNGNTLAWAFNEYIAIETELIDAFQLRHVIILFASFSAKRRLISHECQSIHNSKAQEPEVE